MQLIISSTKTNNSKRLIIIRCDQKDLKMNQDLINKLDTINDNIYFISNNIEIKIKGLSDKIANSVFTAYICQNNICSEPIKSLNKLIEFIKK